MFGLSRSVHGVLLFVSLIGFPALAGATSLLPLATQEAKTLPNGRAEAILSVGYAAGLWFPPFTQPGTVCCQSLLSAPSLGFNIGLGDRVEVQASFEFLLLHQTQLGSGTTSNYGPGDARLFTKVAVLREEGWRPALGLRFGAKLPNASSSADLGTDRFDWGIEALGSKELGPVNLNINLGLELMDNPGAGSNQDDLVIYAVGVSSRDLGSPIGPFGVQLLAEVAGLTGSRLGNDRSAARAGLQLRGESLTLFGGVSAGLIRESENIGGIVGVIWTFQLFGD